MPADKKVTRKLRAILSADVKGYSLLMSDDEAFTVETLKTYRALMSKRIDYHTGRVVDAPGDNLLAEFESAVDAVECAVEIQKALNERNGDLPVEKRLEFRIGVNVGDVIQDGDNLYGEGVNIAARIEGLADAGGVCISRNAYDHIRNKLNYGYEYLGEHSVKNIKNPVRVYKLLMADEDAGKLIGGVPKLVAKKWIWATAILAIVVITLVVMQVYQKIAKLEFKPAKVEEMEYRLPEKPSIAVLAFDNLSGDPEQDYFSDGMAENIITALSKVGELFVIARNSSFTYKGKPVKIQQVSQELGVRYVLEGSVQKSGDRVRITAQLIDAIKGRHIWAEKYDRDLKDIFEIQDYITSKILTALQVQLTEGEEARVWVRDAPNLEVHLKATEAFSLWNEGTKEAWERYGQLASEIVDMAPESPLGYRMLGWYNQGLADLGIRPRESLEEAYNMALKVLSLDESDAFAHALLSQVYQKMKQYDKSIESGVRAVKLAPNGAFVHMILGMSLHHACRDDEALIHLKQAIRLNPFPNYLYHWYLGRAYSFIGQHENALSEFKKALQRAPGISVTHLFLAITYALLGREEEARASAAKTMELIPHMSVTVVSKTWGYKCEDNLQLVLNAMRKAGFPE